MDGGYSNVQRLLHGQEIGAGFLQLQHASCLLPGYGCRDAHQPRCHGAQVRQYAATFSCWS